MFEVGFVVRTGRQENNRGVRALISGQREQGIPLHIVKAGKLADLTLIENRQATFARSPTDSAVCIPCRKALACGRR